VRGNADCQPRVQRCREQQRRSNDRNRHRLLPELREG
jgi:hypothetical protein